MATSKKKAAKKARPKKAAAKKTGKPAGVTNANNGLPCICIQKRGRWYCMKQEADGSLVRCDGPFATKKSCEDHVCLEA